ncbi:hypothetical protein HanPSC8_Chr15g0692301 [Helianthus annuus]|nr:hypothetical protein HanPSC8_Chr15g0692301 [Helianthus annuus]
MGARARREGGTDRRLWCPTAAHSNDVNSRAVYLHDSGSRGLFFRLGLFRVLPGWLGVLRFSVWSTSGIGQVSGVGSRVGSCSGTVQSSRHGRLGFCFTVRVRVRVRVNVVSWLGSG